jgi:hypothetical protein
MTKLSQPLIPVWDDLRFPASAINPVGQASPPTLNVDNGLWEFSATVVNTIAFQVQMPHGWVQYSSIKPHVHWRKKTQGAGTVVWKFEYEFINVGDTFTDSLTPDEKYTTSPLTADNGDALIHLITPFTEIDMTGKRISTMALCRLSRVADDATNDTYAGVAQLLEFDIHYQVDSFGSNAEYIK